MSLSESTHWNRFRPTLTTLEGRDTPASGPATGYVASGAIAGGEPLVQVDGSNGTVLAQFDAFDSDFRGGVRVATGNVDGNSNVVDVVAVPGPGGGPIIRVFAVEITTGQVTQESSFYAFDSGFRNGLRVAVGQILPPGEGTTGTIGVNLNEQIIVGADAGGGPRVSIFQLQNGTGAQVPGALGNFFAFNSNFRGGVRVAAGNVDGNTLGEDQLIVGTGPGITPEVRVYNSDGSVIEDYAPTNTVAANGVNVAYAPPIGLVGGVIVTDGLPADFSQRNSELNSESMAELPQSPPPSQTLTLPSTSSGFSSVFDSVPLMS
jgi:hypothetical protein